MRFLLKPVWFVLYVILVIANLIMSLGMKIAERVTGIVILILLLGLVMSLIYETWDSLKVVGLLTAAGFAAVFILVAIQVHLEDWRDAVHDRLVRRG